jgi:tight adherence protein B
MTPALITGLVSAAVAAGVMGLAVLGARLWERPRDRVRVRIEREFGLSSPDEPLLAFTDLRKLAAGAIVDGSPTIRRKFATMVERSGLGMTPGQLLQLAAVCALVLGVVAGWVKHSPIIGGGAAVVGAILPLLYARHRAKKRDEQLLSQLPEILDLTARFLRAGYSLSQALGSVAGELKDPARELFVRSVNQRDLGLPTEITLRDLADRAGLTEYRIMVMAILVQQQTGGNLTEICERLATVVRERFRVKGMIRALTAEGRLQANILMGLPPVLVLLMMVVKRSYAEAMLSQPKLIAGILISQLIGILWIRKIVNVNF